MRHQTLSGADELDNYISSDDLLGRSVIDANGETVGIVEKVLLDPASIKLCGIVIDNGLLRRGLVVGSEYLSSITRHAVFLSMCPAYNLKGRTAYDVGGRRVGKVVQLIMQGNTNNIEQIVITHGFWKRRYTVPRQYIARMGEGVFLTHRWQALEKLLRQEAVTQKSKAPK